MPSIHSPFRYPGGKYYARKLIMEHVPSHSNYIEVFAGGASIFFAKDKVETNWINDADEALVNTYLHIRDHVNDLIAFLDGIPATKELHTYYKNEFKPMNDLERAGRWYYLNRTSYSGIMKLENCYWGYGDKYSMRPENWPRNLRRTSKKLQGVKITNWDFRRVFQTIPPEAFLFIDPPYFNADQDKFYTCSFSKDDHYDLRELLWQSRDKFRFLLTYDNTPAIHKLYQWADGIYDKEWNYTINRTDDQTKNGDSSKKGERYKGKELFIVNYNPNIPTQLPLFEFDTSDS